MSNKRANRGSPLGGEQDGGAFAKLMSPEALAKMGYHMRDDDAVVGESENALVPLGDGSLAFAGLKITPVGIEFPDDIDQEVWERTGRLLLNVGSALAWALGDWMRFSGQWGETYKVIATEFNYEVETLYTYKWLAEHVQFSIRNRELSPAHHRLVATMSAEEQVRWLTWAVEHRASLDELRQALRNARPRNGKAVKESTLLRQFDARIEKFGRAEVERAQLLSAEGRAKVADTLRALADAIERGSA